MKESLYARIGILEENGIVGKKVADYAKNIVDQILTEFPDAEQDKMEMFITHLVMAGQRTVDGVVENPIDAALLEAMKEEPAYPGAIELRDKLLAQTDIEFPQTEKDFLSVHLCNLLTK